jgi:DNA-directed RNA polymerase specialized sigma24 family protein
MFYLDEMSIQEIADACSVPLGTVKSRLFYARSHLKHVLKREEQ